MQSLVNKIAVVTGASRGLGRAIAEKFAEAGASVAIISRNPPAFKEKTQKTQQEKNNLHHYSCDITLHERVQETIASIIDRYGQIDILVNNAGIGSHAIIEDMPVEEFDKIMAVNVRGAFLMVKYALPHMKRRKSGFIINISSGAGRNGIAGMSAYAASKFALRGFSESLALEAKNFGIRVSTLYPGSINTEFGGRKPEPGPSDERMDRIAPGDVAGTILHMVTSPDRYWINEVVMRAFFAGKKNK